MVERSTWAWRESTLPPWKDKRTEVMVITAFLDCAKAPKKYEERSEWPILLQNYIHRVELF